MRQNSEKWCSMKQINTFYNLFISIAFLFVLLSGVKHVNTPKPAWHQCLTKKVPKSTRKAVFNENSMFSAFYLF